MKDGSGFLHSPKASRQSFPGLCWFSLLLFFPPFFGSSSYTSILYPDIFVPSSCCVLPLLFIYLFGTLHTQKAALSFWPLHCRNILALSLRMTAESALCWDLPSGLADSLGWRAPTSCLPSLANTTLTNSMSALWPDTHSLRLHCSCLWSGRECYSLCSCGLKKAGITLSLNA